MDRRRKLLTDEATQKNKRDFRTAMASTVTEMRLNRLNSGESTGSAPVTPVITKSDRSGGLDFRTSFQNTMTEIRRMRSEKGSEPISRPCGKTQNIQRSRSGKSQNIQRSRSRDCNKPAVELKRSSSHIKDRGRDSDAVDTLIFDSCSRDKQLLGVVRERWDNVKNRIRGYVLWNWDNPRNSWTEFRDEVYRSVQVIVNVYDNDKNKKLIKQQTIETNGGGGGGSFDPDNDAAADVTSTKQRQQKNDKNGKEQSLPRQQSRLLDHPGSAATTTCPKFGRTFSVANQRKNDDDSLIDEDIGDESLERKVREMIDMPGIPPEPQTLRNKMHVEDPMSSMLLDNSDEAESNCLEENQDRLTDYTGFMDNIQKSRPGSTSIGGMERQRPPQSPICSSRIADDIEKTGCTYEKLSTMKDLLDRRLIDRPSDDIKKARSTYEKLPTKKDSFDKRLIDRPSDDIEKPCSTYGKLPTMQDLLDQGLIDRPSDDIEKARSTYEKLSTKRDSFDKHLIDRPSDDIEKARSTYEKLPTKKNSFDMRLIDRPSELPTMQDLLDQGLIDSPSDDIEKARSIYRKLPTKKNSFDMRLIDRPPDDIENACSTNEKYPTMQDLLDQGLIDRPSDDIKKPRSTYGKLPTKKNSFDMRLIDRPPDDIENACNTNEKYPTMQDLLDQGLIDRPFQYSRSSSVSSGTVNTEEFMNADKSYQPFKKRVHEVIDNAGKYPSANDGDDEYCGQIDGNINDGIPADTVSLPPACSLPPVSTNATTRSPVVQQRVQQRCPITDRSVSSKRSSAAAASNGGSSRIGKRDGGNATSSGLAGQNDRRKRDDDFLGGCPNTAAAGVCTTSPSMENLKKRLQMVKDSIRNCPYGTGSHRRSASGSSLLGGKYAAPTTGCGITDKSFIEYCKNRIEHQKKSSGPCPVSDRLSNRSDGRSQKSSVRKCPPRSNNGIAPGSALGGKDTSSDVGNGSSGKHLKQRERNPQNRSDATAECPLLSSTAIPRSSSSSSQLRCPRTTDSVVISDIPERRSRSGGRLPDDNGIYNPNNTAVDSKVRSVGSAGGKLNGSRKGKPNSTVGARKTAASSGTAVDNKVRIANRSAGSAGGKLNGSRKGKPNSTVGARKTAASSGTAVDNKVRIANRSAGSAGGKLNGSRKGKPNSTVGARKTAASSGAHPRNINRDRKIIADKKSTTVAAKRKSTNTSSIIHSLSVTEGDTDAADDFNEPSITYCPRSLKASMVDGQFYDGKTANSGLSIKNQSGRTAVATPTATASSIQCDYNSDSDEGEHGEKLDDLCRQFEAKLNMRCSKRFDTQQ